MAQIGFTHKTEPVYTRFQDMRRAYEDANGRTYAPDFLAVLMDAFEIMKRGYEVHDEASMKDFNAFGREHFSQRVQHPIPPVSLHAYIADAEANDPNLKPENETE